MTQQLDVRLQQLNCEHAARAAAAGGADYLLHVDSDELLYFPRAAAGAGGAAAALGAHLRALAARGALQFTYRNLEAVPEAEECADALRAVSLFKQHPAELHAAPPSAGAAAALRHWGGGDHHFRFYTNGKSLVALRPPRYSTASPGSAPCSTCRCPSGP